MSRRTAHRPSTPLTEPAGDGETHLASRRLPSPTEAAAYLGLQSRFAIYRLVANGFIPAVRLANKTRLDLRDPDAAIPPAPRAPAMKRSTRSEAGR